MKTEIYLDNESRSNRQAIYNGANGNLGIKLVLGVQVTLPICITIDDKINRVILRTETNATAASNSNKIIDKKYEDENGEERYLFISAATSPITYNVIYMYYDKKYKDIIFVPDLSFLELAPKGSLFPDIRCSRLGTGMNVPYPNANQVLSMNEKECFQLPEAKQGATVTASLVGLPGYGLYTDHYGGGFEEYITVGGNTISLIHDNRKLGVMLNLGNAANIFNVPGVIPTYLLYQFGVLDFGIKYLGNMATRDKTLWVTIKF